MIIEAVREILHYRRNLKSLPNGNSLCYPEETTGHFQELQKTPQDQEIVLFEKPISFTVPHEELFNSPEVQQMMKDNKGSV